MSLSALAISALVPSLLKAGPDVIRSIGTRFGGKAETAANWAASAVEIAVETGDARELETRLESMPPEQLEALANMKVELERISAERDKARYAADSSMYAEAQETRRAEIASADQYVRRTRPKLARESFYMGTGYIVVFTLLHHLVKASTNIEVPMPDIAIAGLLLTPALEYIAVRSIDKVKGKDNAGEGSRYTPLDLVGRLRGANG